MTVDVEDFYDGMTELGVTLERPPAPRSGLARLAELLERESGVSATLFVVGNYAPRVRVELGRLVDRGHEVACHGPDHGRLPEDYAELVTWLRSGRSMIEDLLQAPVIGFRSPRFDVPGNSGLKGYRHAIAEAGFAYVSDRHLLGPESPVRELPVLTCRGIPIGGGSYQRLLPTTVVSRLVGAGPRPAVLYYHSYDFGATLPPASSIRSVALAKQLVGRTRVAGIFSHLLGRYGSEACGLVA